LRAELRDVFTRWAGRKSVDAIEQLRGSLQDLARDVQAEFEALEAKHGDLQGTELADFYGLLGSTRGLVEAVSDTQAAIHQINWRQLSTSRF
jgi:hypothetical protein